LLNKDLEETLNNAFMEARKNRHQFMTVEHLLLALLKNSSAVAVIRACGGNLDKLSQHLEKFINETTPKFPPNDGTDIDESFISDERDTQPTLGFQRVLQRAVFHVQSSGKTEVTGANVLVAIFSEHESQALHLLKKQDINRLDVVNYISHGITKFNQDQNLEQFNRLPHEPDEDAGLEGSTLPGQNSALEAYAVNLNRKAQDGLIDPIIGREEELLRTVQVLCRRRKNNPLFVGEAGVGKTAMAEGLAKMIVEGKVPEAIADATVYALDLGTLFATIKSRTACYFICG